MTKASFYRDDIRSGQFSTFYPTDSESSESSEGYNHDDMEIDSITDDEELGLDLSELDDLSDGSNHTSNNCMSEADVIKEYVFADNYSEIFGMLNNNLISPNLVFHIIFRYGDINQMDEMTKIYDIDIDFMNYKYIKKTFLDGDVGKMDYFYKNYPGRVIEFCRCDNYYATDMACLKGIYRTMNQLIDFFQYNKNQNFLREIFEANDYRALKYCCVTDSGIFVRLVDTQIFINLNSEILIELLHVSCSYSNIQIVQFLMNYVTQGEVVLNKTFFWKFIEMYDSNVVTILAQHDYIYKYLSKMVCSILRNPKNKLTLGMYCKMHCLWKSRNFVIALPENVKETKYRQLLARLNEGDYGDDYNEGELINWAHQSWVIPKNINNA